MIIKSYSDEKNQENEKYFIEVKVFSYSPETY